MTSKFYKIQSDFFLIGSMSGKKKDIISFVESQIEKYGNIPNNCKYLIKRDRGSVYHFEIQENPGTGSILETVIKDLSQGNSKGEGEKSSSDKNIFIYDNNDVQYQVYRRKDGTFRTFVRSADDNVSPPFDGIQSFKGSGRGFIPYFSELNVAVYVIGGIFALSLVASLFSMSVLTTEQMVKKGYLNAVSNSPASIVLKSNNIFDLREESLMKLPVIRGLDEIKSFKGSSNGERIGKLIYQESRWIAIPKENEGEVSPNE